MYKYVNRLLNAEITVKCQQLGINVNRVLKIAMKEFGVNAMSYCLSSLDMSLSQSLMLFFRYL